MTTGEDVDLVVEIERLAALDPFAYEVTRTEAAKRLKMRASALDRIITKKRRELGLDTDDEDNGQGRAVKLADALPWHEPVDGDELASTLAHAIKTYIALHEAAADAITLWTLLTWMVNAFTISPRLAITSPTKGCGKTTVLRFLSRVVRRPKRAGSISPSALFRVIEALRPTILLDETEKYIENGGDLHALMNEGHCKGGTVLRVLGDKFELREFSVFGAVAFARNGRLPDDLEQRSIIIQMQRRRADEALAELREGPLEGLDVLARMCSRWADDNASLLADCDPDVGDFINRNADNWRPLFAIADLIGADLPSRIREAAAVLTPRESESTGPMLLGDIKAAFDGDRTVDRLASVELCEVLAAMEDRPWAEWRASKGASPRPITPNQLARLLKPFGISPTGTIRVGNRTPKGYYRHQFEVAWDCYLTPEGVNEPPHRHNATATGTSDDSEPPQTNPDVAVRKCEKPLSPNNCGVVAVQKGGGGTNHANGTPCLPALCAQCGAGDDGSLQPHGSVWLHPECVRFFSRH
jgi:putative DNA primase/helicase